MDQVKVPQFDRAGVRCGRQLQKHGFKAPAAEPRHGRWSICCPPCHHVVLSRRQWTLSHDAWGIYCASLWSVTTTPKMLWIGKEMVHATHPKPWGVNKGLIHTELDQGLHNSASPLGMHSQGQLRFISTQQWAHPELYNPYNSIPDPPGDSLAPLNHPKDFGEEHNRSARLLPYSTRKSGTLILFYITCFGSWDAQHLSQSTAAHRWFAANSWAIL